jgi:hypothetical protein
VAADPQLDHDRRPVPHRHRRPHRVLVEPATVECRGSQALLAAQGNYVGAARYFTNAVDTRTKGVDVVSTYRLNLQQGARADFTLAYNHNDNEVRTSPPRRPCCPARTCCWWTARPSTA